MFDEPLGSVWVHVPPSRALSNNLASRPFLFSSHVIHHVQILGMDTFYVTGMEKSPFAALYRGNMRGQDSEEVGGIGLVSLVSVLMLTCLVTCAGSDGDDMSSSLAGAGFRKGYGEVGVYTRAAGPRPDVSHD